MHVWANAFDNRTTAFAKQKLRNHNTDFYYADETEYGRYSKLDFKIDGQPVEWHLDEKFIDISVLKLRSPLLSGKTIVISTPFEIRVPNSFSRLGHVETSYQITQWYPKPAVYDLNGWHPMPYLDMGEFYSEFGNFDVQITVPENYYIAATGELQTASEIDAIQERISFSTTYLADSLLNYTDFPPSSSKQKTLQYTAEKVHDFAWFADKRFLIQRQKAKLSSGKTVECTVFFTDQERELWKKGAFYVARAVEFYSDRVGEYPYPQATAVQSALSAGAGMEYPMITVIGVSGSGPALDQVITHEVGHNWFYGILASNERSFPWMDEGINSYHDHKYTEVYYPNYDQMSSIMPKKISRQLEYNSLSYIYHIYARMGKDQAPNTHSNEMTTANYFLGAYEKPAMAFKLFENYLGEEALISAMKNYYNTWKFKHPQPKDTKASFEASTGKDLDWLFDGLLFSNATYDYQITSINKAANKIKVVNKGSIAAPLHLSYISEDDVTPGKWQDGFLGEKTFEIEHPNAKIIELDQEKISFDLNPNNDNRKINGSNKGEPLSLQLISGIRTSKKSKLFLIPIFGTNGNDGFQLGLAAHNYGVPLSTFQYYVNPTIGVKAGELIGSFEFRKDIPQKAKGSLRNISIALGGKSYHEFTHPTIDYNLRFTRIRPSLEFEWQKTLVSPIKHFLRYNPIILRRESAIFGRETGFQGLNSYNNLIHELAYEYAKISPINPLNIKLNSEYFQYENLGGNQRYVKLYGSIESKYAYKRKKFIEFRVFGGFFPLHSERQKSTASTFGNFSMFSRGFNDYRYDEHFINRTAQDGLGARQISWNDGGFKNGISNAYGIGLSNNYMASLNLSVDLPFSWTNLLPIKPYFDAGISSFKATSNDDFEQSILYSGGIMIDFQKVVGIYLPLFSSDNISNIYAGEGTNVLQKISFSIDLDKLNPHFLKRWFTR